MGIESVMTGSIIDTQFWKGKNVFLTGHTGFKGAWLCMWLRDLGAEVTGYSLGAPTDPSLYQLCSIDGLVRSVIADIRDAASVRRTLIEAEPDVVIHMAAQPLVRDSYKIPVETYSVNVMGTVHLLEAVRSCKTVRAVVNVTTDKCYENREWFWGYRENEPLGGYDPYSNSKACSELVTASYRSSFFNPADYNRHRVGLASARAGNVVGGGDWATDRLIPDCIRSFLKDETVILRSPHSVRPWQHVLEPLAGYLMLAQKLYEDGASYAEGWNFGPDDEDAKPVEWLVDRLKERWGRGASYRIDDSPRLHEAAYLKLDCSKAKARLDWRPRWRLEKTLDSIVEWTEAFRDKHDVREICVRQIREYMREGNRG